MRDQPTTTRTGVPPVERQPITRDPRGLLDALAVIDGEGWDGETATSLLTYIRCELIRPLTIDIGLRGGAASEAEAAPPRRPMSMVSGRMSSQRMYVSRDVAVSPSQPSPSMTARASSRPRGSRVIGWRSTGGTPVLVVVGWSRIVASSCRWDTRHVAQDR